MPIHARVMVVLLSLEVSLHHRYEIGLTFFEALDKGLSWVPWKMLTLYHKIVEVVSQVLSAQMSPMAVENPKEANLGPFTFPYLVFRLKYVQNDADPVFIILANDSLISISSICLHDAALLVGGLGHLMILELEGLRIQHHWVLSKEQGLNVDEGHIPRFGGIIGGALNSMLFNSASR